MVALWLSGEREAERAAELIGNLGYPVVLA